MANNRTMAQMLQASIEGYEDAIVVPPIIANNFELKQTLINLVQSSQFTGRQDPHNHRRFFNKVTSTFRHPEVPNTTIKLLLFPFSLKGEAWTWLDKEPPHSIMTWEDLVLKYINQFFPPSKTTYLRNEITNFLQKPNETFNEAWERFKDFLRQCPHHDLKLSALKLSTKHNLDSSSCDLHHLMLLVTLDLHAHTFMFEYIRVAKVLICRVGWSNLHRDQIDLTFKKNLLDRISSMSKALLIPK
nr:reverse transcriptase domain-containing protein [Tanacetum cinerariifolium]